MRGYSIGLLGLLLAVTVIGNSLSADPVPAQPGGWGTIRGQVVYGGDKVPEPPKVDVTKDQNVCLAKGPLLNETWVVNPKTKGVKWVVVFLKATPSNPLPIHATLKQPANKQVVLDQPCCVYTPHVLAMRSDQELLAKNPDPVGHNVVIQGFKNSHNIQIPPGKTHTFQVLPESNAMKLSCGSHPWMTGWLWNFEHPYFVVTDENGNFEIKLAPSGPQTLMLWHEDVGYIGGRNGRQIQIQPDQVVDVGKITVAPAK